MRATLERRGSTSKTVRVTGIVDGRDDDADVLDLALTTARETRSSVFGWRLEYWGDGTATVDLYTD